MNLRSHHKTVANLATTAWAVLAATTLATAHAPGNHGRGAAGVEVSHVLVVARADAAEATWASALPRAKTTGQGAMVFSWDQALTAAFPKAARAFEPRMHGGFSEDPQTGIVYTGIPGYGLCAIRADLTGWKKIGHDKRLQANVHGIAFFTHAGRKRIALAQNDAQRVLIVDPAGKVLQDLPSPKGGEFTFAPANAYYKNPRSKFAVTDVTYLDGRLYAVTGYSPGDFVLTARETGGTWTWGPIAWGGRGPKPGQFRTAHGIYAHEGRIYVANREAHQVVTFTPDGTFLGLIRDIPKGSRICNVAWLHDHFFFCPLTRIGRQKSAPIYAHTGAKLVSTIIPGELGIPVLNNIHHVWPHHVRQKDGTQQLYLLIHGWNKGKYAVLKHVPPPAGQAGSSPPRPAVWRGGSS